MALKEKDITEKLLEDYHDVFADVANVLLFDGREVIRADELENALPVSQLKLAGGIHGQERDTVKFWKQGAVVIAAIGLENQTDPDPAMPLRVFSYDGASYGSQVNRYHSEQKQRKPISPFYPVITLVLYFGYGPWRGPRTLRECFRNLPEELEPLVPDYPIRIVEIASLPPERVRQFRSDFRFVADYLVQTAGGGTYVPPDDRIIHVDETLGLLGAITGDKSFEDAVNALAAEGKENVSMCEVVESFRNEGREEVRREYEAILADNRRVIADKDRTLADNRRVIADKDRELEKAQRELKELKERFGLT